MAFVIWRRLRASVVLSGLGPGVALIFSAALALAQGLAVLWLDADIGWTGRRPYATEILGGYGLWAFPDCRLIWLLEWGGILESRRALCRWGVTHTPP